MNEEPLQVEGAKRRRRRHHRGAAADELETGGNTAGEGETVTTLLANKPPKKDEGKPPVSTLVAKPSANDEGKPPVSTLVAKPSAKDEFKPSRQAGRKRPRDDEDEKSDVDEGAAKTCSDAVNGASPSQKKLAAKDRAAAETRAKLVSLAAAVPKGTKHFDELALNPHILSSLANEFKFSELTDIQALAIPVALAGNDLLAEAKTGAGKTLAFLIPIVEIICRSGFKQENGTGAIIIGPTRELCQQIEGVLLRLLKPFNGSITFLCCIGGVNRKTEGYKLATGQQIVVSTPGRLLDHLKLTTDWHTKNMLMLCIDEADRVLDNGFEEDVREIISLLPKKRQTFLFSATQTTRVEQLARVSFSRQPIFLSSKSKEDKATVETLEQGYVMCPSELRFLLLYHFIKRQTGKKVIVFFSSRNSVSYHTELFNYIDLPVVAFHGKQKQHQRSATYMQFCNAPSGVLFTTDVAARGLDIPKVDWIIQFDPPDDPTKYIHRVGRTARAGRCGNALMFLLPSEKLFLKYLYQDARVAVNEYTFDLSKLKTEVQQQLEKLVAGNYYLKQSARQAFEGYLLSYSSCQLKNVFNVQELDLTRVAKGFGLSEPPPVKIDLSQSAAHLNKKARHEHNRMLHSGDKARQEWYKDRTSRGPPQVGDDS